ncbi:hypothetical protein OPV22_030973 [Ensete ventricosum]|uniref:NAC domain-containing protein n=1 Tax=Ensete ventricosum TaxID=4639 RepID=A0AAV8PRJ8_ENSVE|nr:hypothetical protein OPV22_030973 [Ensete ventricosum]
MDRKLSLVRCGALRLPPGFRFHPSDEELVVQYLKRKVFCCPLPASIIPDIDLRKHDPWNLPGGCEGERYFFNLRKHRYPNGKRSNRAASSGYWKATGKDKQIVAASGCNQVVGIKKVFIFYRGKPPAGSPTDWIMHEYRLAGSDNTALIFPQRKNSTRSMMVPNQEDWVLCRIFKKRRATNVVDEIERDRDEGKIRSSAAGFTDFMPQRDSDQTPSSSSSPERSCVAELFEESTMSSSP